MATVKISAMTADTSPTSDDLIPTVNDPGGSPANKKVTLANAITKAHGLSDGAVVSVVAGVMGTAAVTASATELNYVDGVTSAIQTQLDAKQPLDSDLTTIAGLTATTDTFLQAKASAWTTRTPTQVTADLINFVGDSGSGGTKGLVPAPASGDAAAGKYLKADGTWATSSGQTLVTHIVAASGGTHTTLGAAVAAASSGDTIWVREGTYVESAISSTTTNLTIIGEGREGSIISGGANVLSFTGVGVNIINLAFTFSTGRLVVDGNRSKLLSCKVNFTGSPGTVSAIRMNGTECSIEGLYFETSSTASSATSAIVMGGDYSKITGSTIIGNSVNASSRVIDMQGSFSAVTANVIRKVTSGEGGGKIISLGATNTCTGNNAAGYTSSQTGAFVAGNSNCTVSGNTFGGGKLGVTTGTATNVVGNQFALLNGNGGIGIQVTGARCAITGNYFEPNAGNATGIQLDSGSNYCVIGDNIIYALNLGISVNSGATNCIISNNNLFGCTTYITDSAVTTTITNNYPLPVTMRKEFMTMKNTSGGALAAGDIVVLKAVANGDEVTTTTTASDNQVFGMAVAAISDTAYGQIQTLGKTTALKVDGTTDIAIGDFITTFTTVKIGAKAAAGQLAIAIALEAYTGNDSNGVIDALLITPRRL